MVLHFIPIKNRKPFFPEGITQSLEKIGIRFTGFTLIVSGALLIAAIISYHPEDLSWNTATNTPTANVLGHFGAVLSDLFLQTIGFAILLPISCFFVWGVRLMTVQIIPSIGFRLLTMAIASILIAIGLAVLPKSLFWPMIIRPGGFAGGLTLDWIGYLSLTSFSYDVRWIVAVLSTLLGLAIFLFSLGIAWSKLWVVILLVTVGNHLVQQILVLSRFLRCASKYNRFPMYTSTLSVKSVLLDKKKNYLSVQLSTTMLNTDSIAEKCATTSVLVSPLYQLPSLQLLTVPSVQFYQLSEDGLVQVARSLETVLNDFGVYGRIVKVRPGPVVTLCELEPVLGTKITRVVSLSDDIACAMGLPAVRIAVVPGQNVVSIELPNIKREVVYLHELLSSNSFDSSAGKLMLALGKDVGGTPVYVDLARMPHLLIAGTAQSIAVDSIILSLLYKMSPADCRLIIIDSCRLSIYDGIPHLLLPVITDKHRGILVVQWVVQEMKNRYRAMSQIGARNISGYNQRIIGARTTGQTLNRVVQTGFDLETGKPIYEKQPLALNFMPFIILIVDEIADLMLLASEEVENAIQCLAHTARAVGIHLIVATQRLSVDVITSTIKANFPTRISFQVASKLDSRIILGEQGAEQLLGQGDMLYMTSGGRITRVHGPFVTIQDVEQVVRHLRSQSKLSQINIVDNENSDRLF